MHSAPWLKKHKACCMKKHAIYTMSANCSHNKLLHMCSQGAIVYNSLFILDSFHPSSLALTKPHCHYWRDQALGKTIRVENEINCYKLQLLLTLSVVTRLISISWMCQQSTRLWFNATPATARQCKGNLSCCTVTSVAQNHACSSPRHTHEALGPLMAQLNCARLPRLISIDNCIRESRLADKDSAENNL